MGSAASRAAKVGRGDTAGPAATLAGSPVDLDSHPLPLTRQRSSDEASGSSPPRRRRRIALPETPPARRPQTRLMTKNASQTPSPTTKTPLSSPQTRTTSVNTVDCPICLEEVPVAMAHSLLSCRHAFCQPCLRRFLGDNAAARAVPVACPIIECASPLADTELALFLTPAETAALAEAAAAQALGPRAVYCPNASCGVLMEGLKSDDVAATPSECPHCSLSLCPACRVPWHEGQTCLAYRRAAEGATAEGRALTALAAARGWRNCPSCGHLVERFTGCNHVRCRCSTDFCYRCGTAFSQGYCGCFAPAGMREALLEAARAGGQQQQGGMNWEMDGDEFSDGGDTEDMGYGDGEDSEDEEGNGAAAVLSI